MITSCYERSWVHVFIVRKAKEKFETIYIQNLVYNIVQLFCILLKKAMAIVAQVSDVAHGSLVLICSILNLPWLIS